MIYTDDDIAEIMRGSSHIRLLAGAAHFVDTVAVLETPEIMAL